MTEYRPMPTKMITHALTGEDARLLRSAANRSYGYLSMRVTHTVDNLHGGFGIDDQPDERLPSRRRSLQASVSLTAFSLATVRQLRDRLDSLLDDETGRYNVGGLHLHMVDEEMHLEMDPSPGSPAHALLGAIFNTCLVAGYDREEMKLLERLMDL